MAAITEELTCVSLGYICLVAMTKYLTEELKEKFIWLTV